MTDKEKLEKLVAYLMRRMYAHNQMADIGSTGEIFDEKIENAKYEECRDTLNFIDSLQEEPKTKFKVGQKITDGKETVIVSELLDDGSIRVDTKPSGDCWFDIDINEVDKWRLVEEPVNEDLEEVIHKYEQRLEKENPATEAYDFASAIRFGANWQKYQIMEKAVDVEVKVDAGGYPYIPQMELYDYDKDIPLAKEGDKYKVILIKE